MKKAIWMLVLSVLLVACGTSNAEPNTETGNTNGTGIEGGEVVPSLLEKSPLVYEYQMTNQTEKEVTLEFTSSQRFDYAVETMNGEQLFLFSSVASFMQVIGEEKVKQGDSLHYKIDLSNLDLQPGSYVLKAWMTPTEGKKYEVSKEFTVE